MSDKIIQLNEDLIKHDLKDLVRNSVEETLNALLDKEADELVNHNTSSQYTFAIPDRQLPIHTFNLHIPRQAQKKILLNRYL